MKQLIIQSKMSLAVEVKIATCVTKRHQLQVWSHITSTSQYTTYALLLVSLFVVGWANKQLAVFIWLSTFFGPRTRPNYTAYDWSGLRRTYASAPTPPSTILGQSRVIVARIVFHLRSHLLGCQTNFCDPRYGGGAVTSLIATPLIKTSKK